MTFTLMNIPFHLAACGLSYVYLTNGFTIETYGDEEGVAIEDLDDLHHTLALHLIHKPERLNGPEIRFLRKWRDMSIADLAEDINLKSPLLTKLETKTVALLPPLPEAYFRTTTAAFIGLNLLVAPIKYGLQKQREVPYVPPDILFLEKTHTGWQVAKGI